ncbi:MAG: RHS repeat domain-containing protein, partial [Candidatus Acidiferrales bacterium]
IKVIEPDPASSDSLTLETTYTYDPMDSVTQIVQGSQTRTYVYDDAGRKTSETTPEAGTVSYQYNNDGLMTQRTDARGVVTTYGYDSALNRLTSISYNVSCCTSTVPATSTVSYTYGTSVASNNKGAADHHDRRAG